LRLRGWNGHYILSIWITTYKRIFENTANVSNVMQTILHVLSPSKVGIHIMFDSIQKYLPELEMYLSSNKINWSVMMNVFSWNQIEIYSYFFPFHFAFWHF
jgi:hypothetical protein